MSRTNQEKRSEAITYCPGSPDDSYTAEGVPLDEWESWKAIQWANSIENTVTRDAYPEVLDGLDPDALPRRTSKSETGI